jgi:hypothetical protein
MAILFLNNLDINDNQLLNAKVQVVSTAPTAAKGQIYLDSTTDVNTLKYHDGNDWVGLKQLNISNGTFINLSDLSTVGTNVISLRAELSATGTPDDTVYLRGDNTWSPISSIPGTYVWVLRGDSGTAQTVNSGDIVSIYGGTAITTSASGLDTITINHASVSRIDTTSTASPSFGDTFTAVDSVTSNAQGHITALNLKTVTLPIPTLSLQAVTDVENTTTNSIEVYDNNIVAFDLANNKDLGFSANSITQTDVAYFASINFRTRTQNTAFYLEDEGGTKSIATREWTDETKLAKSTGPTYTTNSVLTVTQAEYDAIVTKDPTTLYFIV